MIYRVARLLLVALVRPYFRMSVEGGERLPAEGACVVAPVHRSVLDFGFVAATTRRRLRFMGKESLWRVRWFGRVLDSVGAFPVQRGAADRAAMRRCLEILAGGEPLVVFPEGTRRSGPVLTDLHEGAAYLATRMGVPIVPVGIGGSERAMPKGARVPRPVHVHVVIGEPIAPVWRAGDGRAPRRAVRELTERLQDELQRLFDQAQARVGLVP